MCQSYAKVIISSVLGLVLLLEVTALPTGLLGNVTEELPIGLGNATAVPIILPNGVTPLPTGTNVTEFVSERPLKHRARTPKLLKNDTILAKFENTTIIFGHQHVLFSAPTRAPHRLPTMPSEDLVENLVAPPNQPHRQSKGNDAPIRIDYTSSEERDILQDYSYEVAEDEQRRQELCPGNGSRRQQLLFDKTANKCAKVGDKAHCGPNMVFRFDPTVDNSTVYGYCECDFSISRTPLVYHPELKACFFIYQKAYCESKEWLIFNAEGEAVCEKRTCQKSSTRRSKLLTELVEVPLNGTGPCVPLNQPSKHCDDPEETVHFHPSELFPRCGMQRMAPAPRIISPIRQIRCRPGSYINIVGKCQPAWEW